MSYYDPSSPEDNSAFESLLERIVPYGEGLGATMPADLLRSAVYASLMVIVTGLLALTLPSAEAIRHGSFYLVFGGFTASLDSFMGVIAGPIVIAGAWLLVVNACLWRGRWTARWRTIIVIQAAAGGVSMAIEGAFVALFVINLALWIIPMALGLAVVAAIFIWLSG